MEVIYVSEKWFIYNLYPNGINVQNTLEELNESRLKLENKLKKFPPYKWFTLLYGVEGVKFGIKTENGENIKKTIENELKSKYPDLHLGDGAEDQDTCELIAIATQCRTKLEEKIPISNWPVEKIADILHFMLNPYGYEDEAWAHLLALLNIESGITDQDVRDVVACVRRILHKKDRIELQNNRWVLKREHS